MPKKQPIAIFHLDHQPRTIGLFGTPGWVAQPGTASLSLRSWAAGPQLLEQHIACASHTPCVSGPSFLFFRETTRTNAEGLPDFEELLGPGETSSGKNSNKGRVQEHRDRFSDPPYHFSQPDKNSEVKVGAWGFQPQAWFTESCCLATEYSASAGHSRNQLMVQPELTQLYAPKGLRVFRKGLA